MSEKMDLDALERLADSATPGPWIYQEKSDAYTHILRSASKPNLITVSFPQCSNGQSEADARFTAAARTAIPFLISRIRELESASQPGGDDSPDYNRGYQDGKRDTRFVMLSEGFRKPDEASQPGSGEDTKRLDALRDESWDVRSFCIGEEDIGWRVIEFHQAAPHERVVAEVFKDDPRAAIDAARAALSAANGDDVKRESEK